MFTGQSACATLVKKLLKDLKKKRRWKRQIHFFNITQDVKFWPDTRMWFGQRKKNPAIWEEWRLLCSLCFDLDVLSCEIRSFYHFKNFERDNLWRHGSYKQFRSWPCPSFFFPISIFHWLVISNPTIWLALLLLHYVFFSFPLLISIHPGSWVRKEPDPVC